jgi:sialic acid synthase SpsE
MTFVVAEIGVNWDGNFEIAQDMMLHAKNSGCGAVKFQAYNKELVKDHPAASRLMKSAITKSNVEKIDQIAKSVGIEWFCTPMYPDAVDFLNPYVNKFKIRWLDGKELFKNKSSKILEKILETKKEVMISSDTTPKNLTFYNESNIKWLYCVPKYPCNLDDFDFTAINDYDGFSNHCTHFLAPLSAVLLGAKIIEFHITSDKSKDFFDNNVSFDYTELSQLMELIRLSEKIKK